MKRGPAWRIGPTSSDLEPDPCPGKLANICHQLCNVHCTERSSLLKSLTPLQHVADGVR